MNIRIEGTEAEIAYAIAQLRKHLTIGQISPYLPLHHRARTWRVFLNTAPKPAPTRWTA
ncbi:hypothetical protein ACIBHX_50610 [Nonomuraea sp. NPDC050536]|uniref:hypothetical protein n=1 Tax=Nonomuraea sp. NPDC050536 TaxID=3364366 RepID=UPI0037C92BFD